MPRIGLERSYRPIGAKSQGRPGVQHGAPRVTPSGALVPQALFRPAAVVDGVIRLHAGDDAQLGEARKVLRAHVLGVFDAEAMRGRIAAPQALVQIEDFRDGAVADGVNADLDLRLVRAARQRFHLRGRVHQRKGNAAIGRVVSERLNHPGGRRAQRAVREGFYRAQLDEIVTHVALDARVAQFFPLPDGDDLIHAAGEPAFQFGAAQELDFAGKAAVPRNPNRR